MMMQQQQAMMMQPVWWPRCQPFKTEAVKVRQVWQRGEHPFGIRSVGPEAMMGQMMNPMAAVMHGAGPMTAKLQLPFFESHLRSS